MSLLLQGIKDTKPVSFQGTQYPFFWRKEGTLRSIPSKRDTTCENILPRTILRLSYPFCEGIKGYAHEGILACFALRIPCKGILPCKCFAREGILVSTKRYVSLGLRMLRTLSIPFFEKIRRVPSKRVFFLTRKIPPRIFFAKKEGILSVPSFYAQGVSFCYFCANFGIWNFEGIRARGILLLFLCQLWDMEL